MKRNILLLVLVLVFGVNFVSATHNGVIFGTYVTYKSSTEVYITSGSGRCNGNEWNHFTESSLNLSSVLPAGEDFLYIYVDDSASSYPSSPVFIGSTTEPAWSNSLSGWYNGNDRCIGVVWCDSSGNIYEFENNGQLEYISVDLPYATPITDGNPTGNWESLETTAYIPVNASAVLVRARSQDADGAAYLVVSTYENDFNRLEAQSYKTYARLIGWLPLDRTKNTSRDLLWYGWDTNDNNVTINLMGFRIDR